MPKESNRIIRKYAPLNVSKVTLPSSDKMFFTAGGRRDYPLWQVVNEFGSSYFSGLDVSVYFGDVFVDEIVSINFGEVENVRPLMGYADYTARGFAHGSRLVTGTFAINFKDAGYIPKMLNVLASGAAKKAVPDIIEAQKKNVEAEMNKPENKPYRDFYDDALHYFNTSVNDNTKDWPGHSAMARDLSLEDIVNGASLKDGEGNYHYSNWANRLKEEHWGQYQDPEDKVKADLIPFMPRYAMPAGAPSPEFDVIIKYGQPEDYEDEKPGWGTIEVLRGCTLQGFQKSIDDSGRNVIEVYSFMAKYIE